VLISILNKCMYVEHNKFIVIKIKYGDMNC